MAILIREGQDVDVKQLQALYHHAPWAKGRDPDGIKRMLENTDYVFSAWDGPRLIGFARVMTDRIYRATLWDVVVHPDVQGRGVGETLMKTILSHPVLSRVQKFWLNTRDKQAFYERFGFVRSDQGMVRDNPEGGAS
ncbi:MAG TPA: GNAT family N-acetyltransferase [Nitrospiria bacterium]|nr:GNAT family N-acetyltransferase [Nitrospiria bacterium]